MTKMNQSCVLSMSLVMTGAALAMSLVACSAGPVVTTTESGPDAGPFNKDNKDSGPSSSPVGKLCNKASDCSTGLNCQKATVGTDGVCPRMHHECRLQRWRAVHLRQVDRPRPILRPRMHDAQ